MSIISGDKRFACAAVCLFFVCAAIYYFCIINYSFDVPRFDDYNDVLGFLNQFLVASDTRGVWQALIQKNNEHITLVNHLVYLAVYFFKGEADFFVFSAIGSISVFLIAVVLLCVLSKDKINNINISILSFLAFPLFAHITAVMSMTAISNYTVVLFFLAALLMLSKSGVVPFVLSLFFAFFCVFSQANGLLVIPLGFVFLILKAKKIFDKRVFTWIIFSLFFVVLYFYNYDANSVREGFGSAEPYVLFLGFIAWFFVLIGSVFSYGGDVIYPLFFGVFLFLLFVVAFFKVSRLGLNIHIFLVFIAFILGSIFLVAYFSKSYPIVLAVAPRYKIYSSWFILALVLFLIEGRFFSVREKRLVLLFSFLLFSLSYCVSIPELQYRKVLDTESFKRWTLTNYGFDLPTFTQGSDVDLYNAIANGIWDPMVVWKEDNVLVYSFSGESHKKPSEPKIDVDALEVIGASRGKSLALFVSVDKLYPSDVELCLMDFFTCYRGHLTQRPDLINKDTRFLLDRRNIPKGTYILYSNREVLGKVRIKGRHKAYLDRMRGIISEN